MRRSSPSPAVRTQTRRPSVATSIVPSRSVRRTRAPGATVPRRGPRGGDGRTGCERRPRRAPAAGRPARRTRSALLERLPWCGTFTTSERGARRASLRLAARRHPSAGSAPRRRPRRARPSPRCGRGRVVAAGRAGPRTATRTPSQSTRHALAPRVTAGRPGGARAARRRGARPGRGAAPAPPTPPPRGRPAGGTGPPDVVGVGVRHDEASSRRTPRRHSSGATRLSPGSKRPSREPPASTSSGAARRRAQQEAVALADVDHREVQPAVRASPGDRPATSARWPAGEQGRGPAARRPRYRSAEAARVQGDREERRRRDAQVEPRRRAGRGRPTGAARGPRPTRRPPASCAARSPRGAIASTPRPASSTAAERGTAATLSRTAAGARRWNHAASTGASAPCAATDAATARSARRGRRGTPRASGPSEQEDAERRAEGQLEAHVARRPRAGGRGARAPARPSRFAASVSTSSARPDEHGRGHERGAHDRHVAPDEERVQADRRPSSRRPVPTAATSSQRRARHEQPGHERHLGAREREHVVGAGGSEGLGRGLVDLRAVAEDHRQDEPPLGARGHANGRTRPGPPRAGGPPPSAPDRPPVATLEETRRLAVAERGDAARARPPPAQRPQAAPTPPPGRRRGAAASGPRPPTSTRARPRSGSARPATSTASTSIEQDQASRALDGVAPHDADEPERPAPPPRPAGREPAAGSPTRAAGPRRRPRRLPSAEGRGRERAHARRPRRAAEGQAEQRRRRGPSERDAPRRTRPRRRSGGSRRPKSAARPRSGRRMGARR